MVEPEIAQVAVEGWIIDPDEHSLLDGSINALYFPTLNGETVYTDAMSWHVAIYIWKGGALKCSLSLLPKDLPY